MHELSNNNESFQNPVSPKSSLKGVFADIMPDMEIIGSVSVLNLSECFGQRPNNTIIYETTENSSRKKGVNADRP